MFADCRNFRIQKAVFEERGDRPQRTFVWGGLVKTRKSNSAKIVLLTAFGTLAFYLFATIAPSLPGLADFGSFVQRYFCGHPLEYISTVMFFSGLSILFVKFLQLKPERSALAESANFSASSGDSDHETLLQDWCNAQPEFGETELHSRVNDVLKYVHSSGRSGLEEHLRYLAELASERLHQTYATIRTITWAIPILGFLGTVIGITMAIANVTPEQLDTSLGEVTSGLSTAFDTTALALGMSIAMVFASFMMEKAEQAVQNDVEQFGIDKLLPLFGDATETSPSSHSNFDSSEQFRESQRQAWAEQLAELKDTWSALLQQHANFMKETLDAEVQQTLRIHRESSDDAREVYAAALHQSSGAVVEQTQSMLATFEERIDTWQAALMTSSQSSVQQSEALHELGATLLRMTETEERLTQLQKLLTDNLQALNVADTMEQTASSLTAAVHVLTARTSGKRAA